MDVGPPQDIQFSMHGEAYAGVFPVGKENAKPLTHHGTHAPRFGVDSIQVAEDAAEEHGGKVMEAHSDVFLRCHENASTTRPMMNIGWGFNSSANANGMNGHDTQFNVWGRGRAQGAASYTSTYRPINPPPNGVTAKWRVRMMNMASINRAHNLVNDVGWKLAARVDGNNYVYGIHNANRDKWYFNGVSLNEDTTFHTIEEESSGPSFTAKFFTFVQICPDNNIKCELWMGDKQAFWTPHDAGEISKLNWCTSDAGQDEIAGMEDNITLGCAGLLDAQLIEVNAI